MSSQPANSEATDGASQVKSRYVSNIEHAFAQNVPMTRGKIAASTGYSRTTVYRTLRSAGAEPVATNHGEEYWPADFVIAQWGRGVLAQLVPGYRPGGSSLEGADE